MNKYIIIIVIIAILIVLSLFIQIPESQIDDGGGDTPQDVCRNECDSYQNTAFLEYVNKVCYCQDVLTKERIALYKDEVKP